MSQTEGNFIAGIQVPTLLINRAQASHNIQRMAQKAHRAGAILRPHFKTHQSLEVGNLFKPYGIDRIAVSSVSMAEYFAHGGWTDIMIAFPVNLREMDRINKLASNINLGILVSSPGVMPQLVQQVRQRVRLYIEIDVGAHRTGFHPADLFHIREALQQAAQNPNLVFAGLISHAGHTYQASGVDEVAQLHLRAMEQLHQVKTELLPDYPQIIVSWGDTPSCVVAENFFGAEELRPGNFVYYDLMQWRLNVCNIQEIAVAVAAPVVALHPERNEMVVYAGAVHLSKEFSLCTRNIPHYGMMVVMNPDGSWEIPVAPCFVRRITQEHGVIQLPENLMNAFSVGDLVGILPVHSCLTADLLRNNTIILH